MVQPGDRTVHDYIRRRADPAIARRGRLVPLEVEDRRQLVFDEAPRLGPEPDIALRLLEARRGSGEEVIGAPARRRWGFELAQHLPVLRKPAIPIVHILR